MPYHHITRSITEFAHKCLRFHYLHDFIIVFRLMGKRTVCAVLYLFIILFDIDRVSRTVLTQIHRTITEQAVKVFQPLMAGKILTLSIFKKTMGIFHMILCWSFRDFTYLRMHLPAAWRKTSFPYIDRLFLSGTSQRRDSTGNTNVGIPSSEFHLLSYRDMFFHSPAFSP